MAVIDCRHFSGYKPCAKNSACESSCSHKDVPQISLLIVHLGALGAVVRSTANLRAIKRKYPNSMITWVTDAPAHQLLKNHPAIDRLLTTQEADLLQLNALEFEIAFVIDKSLKAVGVLQRAKVDQVYGFISNPRNGAIVPATAAAEELWTLGLNNQKKFFENQKAETQLMIEALELGEFKRDEYWLPLSESEQIEVQKRSTEWLKVNGQNKDVIIGLNTGCSDVISYKKLTVEAHRKIIEMVQVRIPEARIVLLGGPEDTERNAQIAKGFDLVNSETTSGLRDGLVSVAACDMVVTGDSLGMHMAISQKKQVVAWFGPTCAQEIDLYERGAKILSRSPCSPCWKRTCEKSVMCYDQVSLEEIVDALERAFKLTVKSTSKHSGADSLLGGLAALDPTAQEMPRTVATA